MPEALRALSALFSLRECRYVLKTDLHSNAPQRELFSLTPGSFITGQHPRDGSNVQSLIRSELSFQVNSCTITAPLTQQPNSRVCLQEDLRGVVSPGETPGCRQGQAAERLSRGRGQGRGRAGPGAGPGAGQGPGQGRAGD